MLTNATAWLKDTFLTPEPVSGDLLALRSYRMIKLTQKLVLLTVFVLLMVLYFFVEIFAEDQSDRSHLTIIIFICGLGGGFVSIQQRISKIGDNELNHLSHSWFPVLLIPVYGGVFALVFHLAVLSGIVSGSIFPEYFVPEFTEGTPTLVEFKSYFQNILPMTSTDASKMIFWSFCAGFSERLVPQIIREVVDKK